MLQNMLRCFARGAFSLLNHNENTTCQNQRRYKLRSLLLTFTKVWRRRHRPCKSNRHLSKVGGGEGEGGGSRCHFRTCVFALSQAGLPSVWLGSVSRWKPAAGKPAQREKAFFLSFFCFFLPLSFLKGSSSSIPAAVREGKPQPH